MGKTEMWYVIDNAGGKAHLRSGLSKKITPDEYAAMIAYNTIGDALADYAVQPGYFTYKAAPNALSDDTNNLPAEVGEADISVIDNETIELPAQPECIQGSTTLESDPNPDVYKRQELVHLGEPRVKPA